jgi:hypothetical protein
MDEQKNESEGEPLSSFVDPHPTQKENTDKEMITSSEDNIMGEVQDKIPDLACMSCEDIVKWLKTKAPPTFDINTFCMSQSSFIFVVRSLTNKQQHKDMFSSARKKYGKVTLLCYGAMCSGYTPNKVASLALMRTCLRPPFCANVTLGSECGLTPLHVAVIEGALEVRIFHLTLKRREDQLLILLVVVGIATDTTSSMQAVKLLLEHTCPIITSLKQLCIRHLLQTVRLNDRPKWQKMLKIFPESIVDEVPL